MVRAGPGLGRAGFGARLGDRRMERCAAGPGPYPPCPARLSWAYRLGGAQALAGLAAVAGGQPRHLLAQPGAAIGVLVDHRPGCPHGRGDRGGQRPAAQWPAAYRLCPRWAGPCGRSPVRSRHWLARPRYLAPFAGGGLRLVADHQSGVCRAVPAGWAPVHRPADRHRQRAPGGLSVLAVSGAAAGDRGVELLARWVVHRRHTGAGNA
ncbi:hypothetical protein D3C76_1184280 [compost metagenome]